MEFLREERELPWLIKLRQMRKESGTTYQRISDETGIPKTTIEKIFSGRTRDPKLGTIQSILKCMGYTITDLTGDEEPEEHDESFELSVREKNHILTMRELTEETRAYIEGIVRREYNHMKAMEYAAAPKWHSCLYYDFPVSAGTGEYLDDTTAMIVELEIDAPKGTNYILRISGDSMEPEFSNGDYVYVKKSVSIEPGEIGIFIAAGNVYMKLYTPEGLKSLNPAYKLIPASSDVRCLGKVIGKLQGMLRKA